MQIVQKVNGNGRFQLSGMPASRRPSPDSPPNCASLGDLSPIYTPHGKMGIRHNPSLPSLTFAKPPGRTRSSGCRDHSEVHAAQRLTASSQESPAEYDVNPREHQVKLRPRELPYALGEQDFF
jgi:hypothetical protein